MVRDDAIGYKMAIVEDGDPNRVLVMKAGEDTIGRLQTQVTFGTCEIRSPVDGRKRATTVFPWGESRSQLECIVSKTQNKIEA